MLSPRPRRPSLPPTLHRTRALHRPPRIPPTTPSPTPTPLLPDKSHHARALYSLAMAGSPSTRLATAAPSMAMTRLFPPITRAPPPLRLPSSPHIHSDSRTGRVCLRTTSHSSRCNTSASQPTTAALREIPVPQARLLCQRVTYISSQTPHLALRAPTGTARTWVQMG